MLQNITGASNRSIHSSGNHSLNLFFVSKRVEIDAFLGLTFALCALGTITNSLMLVSVWPPGREKSGFAWQMCHFLLIQLMMCLINVPIPLYGIHQTVRGHNVSAYSCRYSQSFYSICTSVINWSDAGLALNRCIALLLPHKYPAWTTKSVNIFIITFTWIPSTIGYIVPPIIFGFDRITVLTMPGYCTWAISPAGRLGQLPLYLGTTIPYVLSGLSAFLILCKFYWMTRLPGVRRVMAAENRNRPQERRMKRAKVLLLMFLWTGVCVTPSPVAANFFRTFVGRQQVAALWFRLMLPLQYSVTPIILLRFNEEYQKRLTAIFRNFIRNTAIYPRSADESGRALTAEGNPCSAGQTSGGNPTIKLVYETHT